MHFIPCPGPCLAPVELRCLGLFFSSMLARSGGCGWAKEQKFLYRIGDDISKRDTRLSFFEFWKGKLTISATGSQDPSTLGSPRLPYPRYRSHPASWPVQRQACRTPQDPRPGCPPRYWSLQDQRCPSETRQLPICHRHLTEDRPCRCRPGQDQRGLRTHILRSRCRQGQGQRGGLLQAGRTATGTELTQTRITRGTKADEHGFTEEGD